jgi:hypothetical protein
MNSIRINASMQTVRQLLDIVGEGVQLVVVCFAPDIVEIAPASISS